MAGDNRVVKHARNSHTTKSIILKSYFGKCESHIYKQLRRRVKVSDNKWTSDNQGDFLVVNIYMCVLYLTYTRCWMFIRITATCEKNILVRVTCKKWQIFRETEKSTLIQLPKNGLILKHTLLDVTICRAILVSFKFEWS